MLTIIRRDTEGTCCLDPLFEYIIAFVKNIQKQFQEDAEVSLRGAAVRPVGTKEGGEEEETEEEQEKRRKKIRDKGNQFKEKIDKLCDESEKLISKLPVQFRGPATECLISVLGVITDFFSTVFNAFIQALGSFVQTCKNKLQETIVACTRATILKIHAIFQRPFIPTQGNPSLYLYFSSIYSVFIYIYTYKKNLETSF